MKSVNRRRRKQKFVKYIAVLLLAVGTSVGVFTYLNQEVTVPLKESARSLKDNELPSEEKPTQKDIADHKTEDESQPWKFSISRLGIAARVIPITKNKKGVIEAPANIFDVGWLKTTAKPNDPEGFMVIDGHVRGANIAGVFSTLDTIKVGDGIVVQQGSNTDTSFAVTSLKLVAYNEAAETTLLASPKPGVFELRLITCAGVYNKEQKTYDKRLIVTAVRK